MNEVTALVPVLRDCHYAFAVYTSQRTKQRWPLILAAQTEKDMNDWVKLTDLFFIFNLVLVMADLAPLFLCLSLCDQLCLLSDCCCECRGITGPPSRHALWSTTSKGDIMVHEPSFSLETPSNTLACDFM